MRPCLQKHEPARELPLEVSRLRQGGKWQWGVM